MSSDDIKDWLTLANARLDGLQCESLLKKFGSIDSAVRADRRSLLKAGLSEEQTKRINEVDSQAIDCSLSWAEQPAHHLVPITSGDFPDLLRLIPDPPALLYIQGDPAALQLPSLAIVGSRNPTRGGVQNAQSFAGHLGAAGFCILSGLAQGVDTAAHEGALSAGATTVAFLGHGIDRVYPAVNHDLAHRIVERGALVSEYPLGSPPRKEHFPQRNRLISGCSMGVLVVEAAKRSGSLITARLASEQGREVFAIPGSIHNTLSRGCHQLIRQGAKLVESADDIVSELGPMTNLLLATIADSDSDLMQNVSSDSTKSTFTAGRDAEYKLLIKTIGHDPQTPDEIAEKSGLTIEQVSSMLLILELEGEVEALKSGQYSL